MNITNLVRSVVRRGLVSQSSVSMASVHTSATDFAGQEWRRERLKPLNINRYGPFADLPDYTFLDGRRTPPGPNKVKRALKHRAYAEKIIQYTKEMDFAVERHERLGKEEKDRREQILARKLKPKGQKSV